MALDRLAAKFGTAVSLLVNRAQSPERREQVSKLVALGLPRPRSDPAGRQNAQRIRDDGFVRLGTPFAPKMIARVRAQLEQRPCFDAWQPDRGHFRIEDAPEDANTFHIAEVESIRETVEMANDPRILSTVSAYFGCRPTIDDILAWWSLPGRAAPRHEQFFHRDRDSIRFLKLFIHLTDVGDDDGPHVFVRQSHRDRVLAGGSLRKSDADVANAVPDANVIRFTGPAGTTFLEDTSGLHKGALPTTGRRLILQVRYSILPSLNAAPARIADVAGFDPYIHPRIAAIA